METQTKKINGLIIEGKVYITDPDCAKCENCDLAAECDDYDEETNVNLCTFFQPTSDNDFGYRYSQELTDKLAAQ